MNLASPRSDEYRWARALARSCGSLFIHASRYRASATEGSDILNQMSAQQPGVSIGAVLQDRLSKRGLNFRLGTNANASDQSARVSPEMVVS